MMKLRGRCMHTLKNEDLKNNVENLTNLNLGFKYSKLTNSGSEAVLYALKNAKIPMKSFIVLPVTICKSVVDAILKYGCYPYFCDVDEHFCLDIECLNKNVLKDISAVLYVHAYGILKDISDLVNFCRTNNLILIEDSAQYFCSDGKYRYLSQGDFVIFSFGHGKPISADGLGLIASNCQSINSCPNIEGIANLSLLFNKLKNVNNLLIHKQKRVGLYIKQLGEEKIIFNNCCFIDNVCHRLLYFNDKNYQKISDKMYEKMKELDIDNFQSTIVVEAFRENCLKDISKYVTKQRLDLESFPVYKKLKGSYYYFRTNEEITKESIYKICEIFKTESNAILNSH